jgi:hypothetical protein
VRQLTTEQTNDRSRTLRQLHVPATRAATGRWRRSWAADGDDEYPARHHRLDLQKQPGSDQHGAGEPYLATQVDTEAKRKQVAGRFELAAFLGCRAVAAPWGLHSRPPSTGRCTVAAKEARLIGAPFTTADYETLTQPIDAVLSMPIRPRTPRPPTLTCFAAGEHGSSSLHDGAQPVYTVR